MAKEIYWTTFDESGYRIATYLEGIHGIENIPHAAVPLTEEDWVLYCTGGYKRNMTTGKPEKIIPELVIITPTEQRERAYETVTHKTDGTPLIYWEGQTITVDKANKIFLDYTAEGTVESKSKASQIQSLIAPAKTYIRNLYPDIV